MPRLLGAIHGNNFKDSVGSQPWGNRSCVGSRWCRLDCGTRAYGSEFSSLEGLNRRATPWKQTQIQHQPCRLFQQVGFCIKF
eukprot:jgi/Botrbrau1/13730/Bobra.0356s0010.1